MSTFTVMATVVLQNADGGTPDSTPNGYLHYCRVNGPVDGSERIRTHRIRSLGEHQIEEYVQEFVQTVYNLGYCHGYKTVFTSVSNHDSVTVYEFDFDEVTSLVEDRHDPVFHQNMVDDEPNLHADYHREGFIKP